MSRTLSTHEITARDGRPDRWLAVLHGIFGAGRNWGAVARGLAAARPDWGVLLVDLRQHGASMGFAPPHTLDRAAGDLGDIAATRTLPAVLGHSFGGKVALLRARDDARVEQAWIVDSTPEAREPGSSAWAMLGILRALPAAFAERADAVAALVDRGVEEPTARWMTTNLDWQADAYHWRLDFDDMEAMMLDFFRTDLWDVVENPRPGLELHFLRATRSSVLGDDAARRIRAAGERTHQVFLHDVTGGHWLNADNPDALVELIARRLGARSS